MQTKPATPEPKTTAGPAGLLESGPTDMFSLTTNHLGDFLLYAGIVLGVFCAAASLLGRWRRDGRLLLAGERAGYAVTGAVTTASFLLVHSFLTHDYANKYVARYSDNNMPWYYLVSAFWGGQAGSLLFWCLILGVVTAFVIWQNRDQNREIMPTVLSILMVVQVFFLGLMVLEANPFDVFRINEPPVNGKGLEPLLQNPAMTFHPPSILSGYVWFTAPFAFALASLIHGRLDDSWIRTTRRYAVISWAFLSMGNLFGGMWAYEELGWGGFWGWDPVENASFMPWITATAYLHSVMIQERRGMLKVWNISLVLLTYFLTVFGTFLTRSGLIDSVHTFAQSDVGDYFVVALAVLAAVSVGMVIWRVVDRSLRSDGQVTHMFSREGVFLLNNFVLLVAVAVVMFGTLGEKISAYFWQQTKYTAPWFNTWMAPIGILLLVLMGIGPLIPWRKATWKNFRSNFLLPTAVSAAAAGVIVALDVYHLRERLAATRFPIGEVPVAKLLFVSDLTAVYAILGIFGVFFVFYSMAVEFVRGATVRARSTGEGWWTALGRLSTKNKRRYGGYITHIGFAALFLGFIGTGLKTEVDMTFNAEGASQRIEDRVLTFRGFDKTSNREYEEWFARFDVSEIAADGSTGPVVATLKPSRRFYHGANVQMSRTTTEKDEIFGMGANMYLALVSFRPELSTAEVMAHYNPMILWMWIGGALLLIGVVFAIWPEAQPYPVFAAAQRGARRRAPGGEAAEPSPQGAARSSD